MRDYLYIPLGGNRVSGARLYFNLWVVFLISGFWHGAEWTFILWGAYHGFFLAIERLFLLRYTAKIGTALRVFFTFLIVVFGWILFRAKTASQAFSFYAKMFSFSSNEFYFSSHVIAVLLLAALLSFIPLFLKRLQEVGTFTGIDVSLRRTVLHATVILALLILCVGEITSSDFNPFIYFRF
jgi:alginate O-acetyltransferase complex protein AlgI